MDLHLVALAVVCFLAPVCGLLAGFYGGRRASIDTYTDLGLAFEKERVSTAILRDEIVELLERVSQERKRVTGERTRMEKPAGAAATPEVNLQSLGRDAQLEAVKARYQPREH